MSHLRALLVLHDRGILWPRQLACLEFNSDAQT
jgi:hypothetical protein